MNVTLKEAQIDQHYGAIFRMSLFPFVMHRCTPSMDKGCQPDYFSIDLKKKRVIHQFRFPFFHRPLHRVQAQNIHPGNNCNAIILGTTCVGLKMQLCRLPNGLGFNHHVLPTYLDIGSTSGCCKC